MHLALLAKMAIIAFAFGYSSGIYALTISEGEPITWTPELQGGAWWGDVATPLNNQLWTVMLNPTPDIKLTSPVTYRFGCRLPVFPEGTNTLWLDSISLQVDGNLNSIKVKNPKPDTEYLLTISPNDFKAGWHELSFKCTALDQAEGPEQGNMTVSRVSFGVAFGTPKTKRVRVHNVNNYLDVHGWYGARNSRSNKNIGYQISLLREQSAVYNKELSGNVIFKIQANNRDTGNVKTQMEHIKLLIDGVVPMAAAVNAMALEGPAEWENDLDGSALDKLEDWDITIDTTQFCNGRHWLAVHSHKVEVRGAEAVPGMQLATQTEVPFYTYNEEKPDCDQPAPEETQYLKRRSVKNPYDVVQ